MCIRDSSNSFSKPITINVLSKEEYNKKKLKQKKVPKIDSHLHPDMTFSNFIVGNSNRMAQNAALLVSTFFVNKLVHELWTGFFCFQSCSFLYIIEAKRS